MGLYKKKYISDLETCVATVKKTLFQARERQIAEMAGLGNVFPCVPHPL